MSDFINKYISNSKDILDQLDVDQITKIILILSETRLNEGRLFILGVGGGAGHASHAVNDFRKICGIEAYSPSDNVSELTARVNDDGWDTSYVNWLMGSRLKKNDSLLIFSVGGGNLEKSVSVNIVKSLQYAMQVGSKICGIVGRDGGYTAEIADACVIVPTVDSENITPHTEGFQALVWHLLVAHPDLQKFEMKWESVK
jgi:D-sedoheptulose 7-phosphate isomerase